jgi:predicted RNase H-like HicB family nuclease
MALTQEDVFDTAARSYVLLSGGWSLVESSNTEPSKVVGTFPIPPQLVDRYVQSALRYAATQPLDDGEWYAAIEHDGFEGVWAVRNHQAEVLDELKEVLTDWVVLKFLDRDLDIPVVEGINLNLAR